MARILFLISTEYQIGIDAVSAINGTKLAVTFNKTVSASTLFDATTKVIDATALTITGLSGAATVTAGNLKGSLSADSKTLYIDVTGGTEYFDGNYAVEVTKDKVALKDNASKFISEYKGLVNTNDTVAPSIESVSYDGTDAVITLSEPIQSEGTVSLNGTALVSGTGYTDVVAGDKTITVKGLEAGKSYNLQVVGAKDVKGNIAAPLTASLSVPTDSVKPTVTTSVSGTKVTFEFSEELKGLDLDATPATTEFAKVTFNGGTSVYLTAAEQDATNKKKFVVDLGSQVSGDFLTGSLKVEGFQDKSANAGDVVNTTVTLSKDKVAPKFVSATAKDGNLIVKFDEDVANNSLAAADLTVDYTDADGVLHTGATITTLGTVADKYDANGNGTIDGDEENYIVIPFTSASILGTDGKLLPGSYKVTIAANKVKDTSSAANLVTTATTFTVDVAKNTTSSAVVEVASAVQQATPGQIKVTFNNELSSSALTAANYKLGGVTLPSGTKLVFVGDKKNVLITLPAGFVAANGDQVLEVANLTDKDGNTLKADKTKATVTAVKENVAPTATKVNLVDGQNLTVEFSEALAALPTVSGVKVKVNGAEVALDGATPFALDATKKIVTVKASSTTAFKLTDAISVEITGTNITDVAGNAVTDAVVNK